MEAVRWGAVGAVGWGGVGWGGVVTPTLAPWRGAVAGNRLRVESSPLTAGPSLNDSLQLGPWSASEPGKLGPRSRLLVEGGGGVGGGVVGGGTRVAVAVVPTGNESVQGKTLSRVI